MIVLGKDKIDTRFNIDDNGVITNLQGVIQQIYYRNGRPVFKDQYIYRILMYTKYGYQNKDVHHIDENILNNNINNLEYLSHKEHVSHHSKKYKGSSNPMYGKTGTSHPMYGKHHSEETKKKMSLSRKGKHWKKDPITGKRIWY